jgi:hypothetical protein
MPNLLNLQTECWCLNVWTSSIDSAKEQLKTTLRSRGTNFPKQEIRLKTRSLINLSPSIEISGDSAFLQEAIFFENRSYEFEFLFTSSIVDSHISHRLNSIQNAFRDTGNSLRGMINFGNDIGWFRLTLHYRIGQRKYEENIAFEVMPIKMDLAKDFNNINLAIDEIYPLWRFSFSKKTDQELSRSKKPHERFPLLWLALFESLRVELNKQIRIICNSPHSRLQAKTRYVNADRLRGKLNYRIEEGINAAIASKLTNKLFRTESRRLSVNTPENRFVLMVIKNSSKEIAKFMSRAIKHNGNPENERVSSSFFDTLGSWQSILNKHAAHSMFVDVDEFEGLGHESLVLHQRAGYAGVYRVWQQLKEYLEVFGRHASISMKSVAELYEVWCFLEIRRLLLELGFQENDQLIDKLSSRGVEKELKDGIGASFKFLRNDGITIRLAHEPIFGKPKKKHELNSIYSWHSIQRPDIVLEATFPNGELIHWIFDAKYRVEAGASEYSHDLAPDDAINQMHRYRDALIHLEIDDSGKDKKSRPVIGAFVLYPGWYPNQTDFSENPYSEGIYAVGIGAFPALPGQDCRWLKFFLEQNLIYGEKTPNLILNQDSVLIPPTGLMLTR